MNPRVNDYPTPAQQEASRRNGAVGGRPRKDTAEIPCLCRGRHRYSDQRCPRGRREWRREYDARPEQVAKRAARQRKTEAG